MELPFYPADFYHDGTYMIGNSKDFYRTIGWADGEYKVVGARILGLSYPSYLRLARDKYNGTIGGVNQKYLTLTFKNYEDCNNFCNLLNQRWSELNWGN